MARDEPLPTYKAAIDLMTACERIVRRASRRQHTPGSEVQIAPP